MTERTYVLTVPGSPKSVNAGGAGSRANHFAAHREKKEWEGKFLMELLAAGVLKQMQYVTVWVHVRFKHRAGKGRDVENYRPSIVKPLLDALQVGGYLENDNEEWVKVEDVTLEEGDAEWPFADPRLKSYMDIRLEASYL